MPDLFADHADTATQSPPHFAQVALEQGIDASPAGLTYRVPDQLSGVAVGDRVMVPLGRKDRRVAGYIVELVDTSAYFEKGGQVKPILGVDPKRVSLPVDLIELARWVSSYYCCPLGMVFGSMLPAAVKRGIGAVTRTMVRAADDSSKRAGKIKLSPLQRKVLERAVELKQWTEIKRLADAAGARSISSVRRLIDKGLLEQRVQESVVSDLDLLAEQALGPTEPFRLNRGQQTALDHLLEHLAHGFGVHLIHGVTGSGKTEVYLRLIEKVLPGTGAGVIVMVPEIALTPQTVARFLERFEASSVAVLHSGLTAAQRHAQWRRIRDGRARIVVGARSAVFAPLAKLGLVIVDEEHEHSYKQDQLPRYHARDVAIKRGQLCGCPVVLGSATPSLESYFNATRKRSYHLIRMPDRVPGMKLPAVEIIDMLEERKHRRGVHLISRRLEADLARVVAEQRQAMLLLNRRGYANYIACPDHRCGWLMTCDYCDVTMVYHRDARLPTGGVVRCHHCEAEQVLPKNCPSCGKKVTVFGLGTQRVEEELSKKLPGVRAVRMDSDTMRRGKDYQDTLDQFRRREIVILLGTQMIAKGLDFPGVRLVGVISADTSLHMPDFRSAERTFGLIAQVAGRAGRSAEPGRVIVQTFNPTDPVIGLAAQHDYVGFAEREIELRGSVGLPPVTRMARIVVRDKDHLACVERAKKLSQALEQTNRRLGVAVRLRGPAPSPIARIAGFHRQQIEMIAADAARLQKLMTAVRNDKLLVSDMHTAVDVDPVSLL